MRVKADVFPSVCCKISPRIKLVAYWRIMVAHYSKKKRGIFNKRYPDTSSIFKIYCFISFSFVYTIAFLLITNVGMRQMVQNALELNCLAALELSCSGMSDPVTIWYTWEQDYPLNPVLAKWSLQFSGLFFNIFWIWCWQTIHWFPSVQPLFGM